MIYQNLQHCLIYVGISANFDDVSERQHWLLKGVNLQKGGVDLLSEIPKKLANFVSCRTQQNL